MLQTSEDNRYLHGEIKIEHTLFKSMRELKVRENWLKGEEVRSETIFKLSMHLKFIKEWKANMQKLCRKAENCILENKVYILASLMLRHEGEKSQIMENRPCGEDFLGFEHRSKIPTYIHTYINLCVCV